MNEIRILGVIGGTELLGAERGMIQGVLKREKTKERCAVVPKKMQGIVLDFWWLAKPGQITTRATI